MAHIVSNRWNKSLRIYDAVDCPQCIELMQIHNGLVTVKRLKKWMVK